MKSQIIIKPHLIYIESEHEFAVLQKIPNDEGLQSITFSCEISLKDADIIEKSGIAEVESIKTDGILIFRSKSFYETHLMCQVITDILKRHEPEIIQ